MENVLSLLQILLDAGLLFLCLERIFRNKNNPFAATDWLLYPVIVFFCMAARVSITAGLKTSVLFPSQRFEIAPANNFFLLLFLILAFALMSSLYYKPEDNSYTLCGSKIIAGMLYEKIKQASLLQIDILVQLKNGFKTGILPETQWIEILGILLDNAIEASKSGDTIYIQSRKLDRSIELTVSNPFTPMSNTEFVQLFRKGFTTKDEDGGRHGFGLYNVLAIMERYHALFIRAMRFNMIWKHGR